MTSKMDIEWCAQQQHGHRDLQNDSYQWNAHWACVCDGVGAEAAAREAANAACATFAHLATAADPDWTSLPLRFRNRYDGPGQTTIAGCHLDDQGQLWLVNLGDSRALVVRRDSLLVVTAEHNKYAQDGLLARPQRADDRNLVLRCLSRNRLDTPEVQLLRAHRGDVIWLFTDGLSSLVTLGDLVEASSSSRAPGQDRVGALDMWNRLVADQQEPDDNLTCLVGVVQ